MSPCGFLMKLHTKILLGLAAGAIAGVASRAADIAWLQKLLLWIEPVGTAFIQLIMMVVVPLVVASLFVAMASLGQGRRLASLGGRTLAYFLATTAIGSVIGMSVALVARPGAGLDPATRDALAAQFQANAGKAAAAAGSAPGIAQLLLNMIPQNPFGAAARMELLPLIICTIIFGVAASRLPEARRQPLVLFFQGLNDICMLVIRWVMVLSPYAVFALIGATVARFGTDLLQRLLVYCVVVWVAEAVHVFGTLAIAMRMLARLKVTAFFRGVAKALLVAFSTASSNATLPVSIEAAEENLGVPPHVASFVLPLGTSLNLNGAAVYRGVTAIFVAQVYGLSLGLPGYVSVVVASTLALGVGVPGSSLITTLVVLNAIGLGSNAVLGLALVLGVDRLNDMARSTVNVISSLICAAYVGRCDRTDRTNQTDRSDRSEKTRAAAPTSPASLPS